MATAKTKIELLIEGKVRDAINDLKKTDQQIDNLSNSGKKLNNVFSGAGAALKAFVGALAVREVAQFALETARLADKSNDLRRSLNNLASKEGVDTIKLMKDLREATKGTVSDIELMSAATRGKFLGVDLKNLPVLFEFAAKRAKDTGEEINYLVESIVLGIGRRSAPILDNLGIQTRDLDEEMKSLAQAQGTWNGEIDESIRKLYLQEAAINIAKKGIQESGEQIETSTDKLTRMNAQWENFKVVIGEIIAGPAASLLDFVNKLLSEFRSPDPVQRLKELNEQFEKTRDLYAKMVMEADKSLMGKFILETGGKAAREDLIKLAKEIKEVEKQLAQPPPPTPSRPKPTVGLSKKEIEEQRRRQQEALDLRVEFLRRVDEMEAFFEEKKLERLDDAQMAELDAIIETTDAIIQANEDRLARQVEMYQRVAGIISNAFIGLAGDLADSASTGSQAWSNFFRNLKIQIAQFLVSEAVKGLLRTLGNFFFPGAGSLLGGIFGFQHGGFIKGSPGGQIVRVGENNTDELIVPIPSVPNINPPALTQPAGGGLSQLIERVTNNNTEKVVRVVVETADPGFTRIRQHYVDVNRNILRGDNKFVDQYLQTKKSKFEE